MANTYESKFKGVEIDDGVNIATYATGTGGINVTIKGTTNVTGTGGRHLEIDGSGKQDKLTVSSNVHINSLMADHAITLGSYSSGNVILLPQSGASGNVYFPQHGGYLVTTDDIPAVVQATGSSMTSIMSQKAVTDELRKKQDEITDQTWLNARALSANSLNIGGSGAVINGALTIATSSADGLYFTNETGAGISYRILVAASGGTAPLARLTVPNDIAGKTQTIATREYVNAHSSSYNPGDGISISGNTISLAKHIMVHDITLGNYSSGNVILLPQSGASGNVYFPKYGGTLATTNEVPAIVSITGTGTTTVMSQKAVTEALTGKQDKLTMGAGLSMTGNVIYCNGSLTGVTLDVNNIKISGQLDMSGTMVRGGLTYDFPTKGGTFALTSDIPTGGGGSAGVSSIGGKTGAITLGTGLSMNGNELSAEGGGGTTYYQHLLRSKYTHGSAGRDYQFYMTVISTQSSEAGGLTDLVLNSANITVGIDAAQSGAPRDYAGFVPAIMIENPDDPLNSTIFFVDTINNMSYAVAVGDTEFISDSVETL